MLSGGLKGVVAQTLCKKKPKGRTAALEVLVANDAVSALIREGKTHQLTSQMQMGGKAGMQLLNDALVDLVKADTVEATEAYIKAVNKQGFLTKLQHAGISIDLASLGEGPSGGPAPMATDNPVEAMDRATDRCAWNHRVTSVVAGTRPLSPNPIANTT